MAAAGDPFLIDVTTVRERYPDWWFPADHDFTTLVLGRTHVKVRALIAEEDGGSTLELAQTLWIRVEAVDGPHLSGSIDMSKVDHPDWRPGGHLDFETCHVWDICHFTDDGRPILNAARARTMAGKVAIIGMTTETQPGVKVREQTQFVGVLAKIDAYEIVIRLLDGGEITLPPDIRSFENAVPGDYRLRSTGKVIIDPDFTSALIYGPGRGFPPPKGPWEWRSG